MSSSEEQRWVIGTVSPDAADAREICEAVIARRFGETLDVGTVVELMAECVAELRAAGLAGVVPTIKVVHGVASVTLSKAVNRIDCTIITGRDDTKAHRLPS